MTVYETHKRKRKPPLDEYSALELIAFGIFFVGGAIIGLAVAVVYIGINLLNVLGAEWHWFIRS